MAIPAQPNTISNRTTRTRTLLLFLAPLIAMAQPRMSEPRLGYVFDRASHAIRGVAGVPGAAGLDASLSLGQSFSNAFVHPVLPLAMGAAKGGEVYVAAWKNLDKPTQSLVTTVFGAPSTAAFATGTDRALLVSSNGVELWTGLADAPSLAFARSADMLNGIPRIAALSSDGSVAAVVLQSGDIVELSGDSVRVVARGSSAYYTRQTAELLVVDMDGALMRIHDGVMSEVARHVEPNSELAGVFRAGQAFLWNAASGTLAMIDMNTGTSYSIDCTCRPIAVRQLALEGIWYVEDVAGSLLLVDSTGDTTKLTNLAGFQIGSNP